MKALSLLASVTLVALAAILPGCQKQNSNGKPTVAYVTNGIDPFWLIGQKGAEDAAAKYNVNLEVKMPQDGVADQKRMVQELLARGVDGIAISPIDPGNQGDLLKEIADRTRLITQDSDAPDSKRLCYIGMNNYDAGRMAGKLVKEAMPDGGSVMIFVGRLGQENARLRRQGVIDELLNRKHNPKNYDEPDAPLKGEKYVILDTRTDQFDYVKAKALAQDAITRYPNIGCMVGLFAYNPPKILEAVKNAGRLKDTDNLKRIKIVGFDEARETLQGIKEGYIQGTVVQNPYQYGYKSVEVLAGLIKGNNSIVPASKFIDIPARTITQKNVDEFTAELNRLTGKKE